MRDRRIKLTDGEVARMRELYAQGWSQGRLSREYGMSVNTVGRIVRGESRQNAGMLEFIEAESISPEVAEAAAKSQERLQQLLDEATKVNKLVKEFER